MQEIHRLRRISNKCSSNKKQPQLKVEPIEGRSIKATLNHHPVEDNINKALKGTTLNHQECSITQDRSTRRKEVQGRAIVYNGRRSYTRPRFQR
jgi:hypothetical protein